MKKSKKQLEDYEKIYASFWKDLVEKNGKLNKDQIMRELSDYYFLLEEVPKVYDAISGGRLSYPNYFSDVMIGQFEERCQESYEQGRQEVKEEYGLK